MLFCKVNVDLPFLAVLCVLGRQRNKETQRHTETESHKGTETQTETQRHRDTDRDSER